MSIYDWLIQNKELLKIVYALVVVFICTIIVLKTDKLFRISSHRGIQYFRNAFFFYGIGFFVRFFIGSEFVSKMGMVSYFRSINLIFEFFLIMGGFFLVYSLMWKRFEIPGGETYASSLLNSKISLFYLMAVVIVFLDYLWTTHIFMFISQIILFAYASIVSYTNCIKSGKEAKFLNFYLVAMLLSLAAWTLNAISWSLNWNQALLINVYILNTIVFLLFLYGVVKVTKSPNK